MHFRPLICCLALALPASLRAEEPAEAFRPWSAFSTVDMQKAATGAIVTQANTSMALARGISTQAVYLVPATIEATARMLLTWDPSKFSELGVYEHRKFATEKDAGFSELKLDTQLKPVRSLLEAMRKRDGLQLTAEEIAQLPQDATVEEARKFWAALLKDRWTRMSLRGDFGKSGAYDSRSELQSLLAGEPKIAEHFATLLAPITQQGAPGTPVAFYWGVVNVNRTAEVELGAIYSRVVDGRRQFLDVAFFASSGYLATLTLYEMLPVTIGGEERTLVWQGCLVSSTEIAGGFGVKRQIAGKIMLSDWERWIRFFQQSGSKP